MKSNFVKNTTKLYFGIKGFVISMLLKKGEQYYPANVTEEKNVVTSYHYRGDKTFCITREGIETHFGVTYLDSKLRKYKNWEIGILNFKKK